MADEKAKAAKPAKGQQQGGQAKGQQGGGKKDKAAAGNVDHAPKAREGAPRLQTYYQETVRGRLAKSSASPIPTRSHGLRRSCSTWAWATRARTRSSLSRRWRS
jgi:hypothetical protein